MAPETGFSSGEQQQSSSWLSGGGLGGLGSGSAGILGGGLDSPLALGGATVGLGAPWLDPTGHAGSPWGDLGGAAKDPGVGNQLTIKPERDSKAEIQAAVHTDGQQGPQTPGAAKSPPGIQSPEQLDKALADPNSADAKRVAALGMSPQQYKQEYLHEFMARLTQTDPFVSGPDGKPLIGKDGKPVSNYTEGQKAALQQWGYNPVIDPGHVVDHNADTGLFAIRFDPTAAGAKNGAAPVVAFRGTEPDRGTKDLQSDVEGKYIGASQYDPAKAEIQQKLFGGPNKVDVVGYSLGGALAQKSLVDNAQNVRALSTFQAPGISGADASAVNADIAKYGIDANHHFFTNDIVHRAGESKVNGAYHEYTRPDWATGANSLEAHTSSFLIGSDASKGALNGHGQVQGTDFYPNQTDTASIQSYQNDHQADRGFWEQQRQTLGPSASRLLDLVNPAQNLWQKTDSEGNVQKGPDGKPIAGPLQAAYNQAQKGVGEAGNGLSNMAHGGGQTLSGLGDLLHGNFSKGFGEIGSGLSNGWNGVKQEGHGIVDMFQGAKHGLGTLGNFAIHNLLPRIPDMGRLIGDAPELLGQLSHDPSVQKMLGPITGTMAGMLATAQDIGFNPLHPIASIPNMIGKGINAAAGPVSHLASTVGTGISNGYHSAVNTAGNIASTVGTGISNGYHSAVNTAGNIAHTVGTGISNGYHSAVDTAGHVASSVGTGISNGYHSAVNTASNIGHGISDGVSSLASKARKWLPW